MSIPRITVDEPCPLDDYGGLSVRVLANSTDAAWKTWTAGTLGTPGCVHCAALWPTPADPPPTDPEPTPGERRFCPACTAARAAFGRSIVTFYGPTLLAHDVSTPERALALFDADDLLPSEIVIWLQLVPGTVRNRRQDALLSFLTSSSTTPTE